jgi:hypothetical protein
METRELRKSRDQIAMGIEAVFDKWRTDKHKTFNDWFEEEAAAFGTVNLKQYADFLTTLEEIFSGRREPDPNINPLLPPPPAVLISTLVDRLHEEGIAGENIWPTLVGYLTSPTLKEIPFLKISSMLWAAVARKAANRGKRPPSRGMSNDIDTISTLLPYCDAMFIDKECWTYLNEGPLRTELNFGTKLFSLNNKQEFFEYLDAIRASATPEHLATVQAVYGEDCPAPYTSIYRDR